jgi:hypothetical protein
LGKEETVIKGKRADNVASYEYPRVQENPERTVWLDGPNAGKTLKEAPRGSQAPERFILDPDVAASRLIEKKMLELGDIGQLSAQSSALGYLKAQVDGELGFAKLVKEQPQYFPKVSQRPRWFYPWLLFAGCLLLLMQLVVVANVVRQNRPTLQGGSVSRDTEPVEALREREGRVAPFPGRDVTEESTRSRRP